jgi:hypothetical protein
MYYIYVEHNKMANSNISLRKALLATVPVIIGGGVAVFAIASNYPGVVEVQLTPTSIQIRVDGRGLLKPLLGADDFIKPPNSVRNYLNDETANFRC